MARKRQDPRQSGRLGSGRVTIRDVADRAGVSISTVSHAFSGARPISEATRNRVLAAAEDLGYNPNPSARSLRTGRSGLIGMILRPRDAVHGSTGGTETFNRLSGAVATAVLARGLGLVQVPSGVDPAGAGIPMDGCIVAHPYPSDGVLTDLIRRGVPVVTIDTDANRPDLRWSVNLDYAAPVTQLLEHMRAEGARRVLLLTGTEDNAWRLQAVAAYEQWCQRNQQRCRHLSLYEGEGVEGATELARSLLSDDDRPDAVIAASSRFTAGILAAATQQGVQVPHDLMLAALTDSEHSRSSTPPVTGTDLVMEDVGTRAVELLLSRLDGGGEPPEPLVLQPVVRWRASTARQPAPVPM